MHGWRRQRARQWLGGPDGAGPPHSSDTDALFQVLADRYERASVRITANLPFSEWARFFPGAPMMAALLDRLTHR